MDSLKIISKLNSLKKKHSELNDEYGEIYDDGMSNSEDELVTEMRKIENCFRMLDLNVFIYKLEK